MVSHGGEDPLEAAIGQYIKDQNGVDDEDNRAMVKADPKVLAYIKKKYGVQ